MLILSGEDDRANQKDFYGAWEPDRKAKKNEYRHESEEEWAMKVPPQLRAARAELFEVEDSLTGEAPELMPMTPCNRFPPLGTFTPDWKRSSSLSAK